MISFFKNFIWDLNTMTEMNNFDSNKCEISKDKGKIKALFCSFVVALNSVL